MAITRLLARALDTKHADTVTIANTWAQGDTVIVTINTRQFIVTIGTLVTTAQVANTLYECFNGQTAAGSTTLTDTAASCFPSMTDRGAQGIPEFADVVASISGSVVTLTGRTAGLSHTITASEVTAGTGTATLASSIVASGTQYYNNVNNWTEGSVPAAADDAYLDNEDTSIKYGLSNAGATLTSLNIHSNYTGEIGLPKENPDGYTEYRNDYLAVDVSTIKIGLGEGTGTGRIKLDNGTVQTALEVIKTGSSAETSLPAVIWKGTHAGNTVNVKSGSFGAGVHGGEVATIATFRMDDGDVALGAGCTLTTVVVDGGRLVVNSAVTTLTVYGGEVTIYGSGTIGTLNVLGGTVRCMTSGTITTLNVGGAGSATIDFSGDPTPRTVTTTNLDQGGEILMVPGSITFTNKPAPAANCSRIAA